MQGRRFSSPRRSGRCSVNWATRQTPVGGGRGGDQSHPALPSLGGALVSSSSLFFSTAGVLKGARCGSGSKGGGAGGGVAEMLGRAKGDGQNAPTCPRDWPATGQVSGQGQGTGDKLSQVSPGKRDRVRAAGALPQHRAPGNLTPEPSARTPRALPTSSGSGGEWGSDGDRRKQFLQAPGHLPWGGQAGRRDRGGCSGLD